MPRPIRAARRRAVAVLVVSTSLALLAGACSDDDGDAAGSGDDAPASTEPVTGGEEAGGDGSHGGTLARYAGDSSDVYADPANWVCRPDVTDDACDADLDATVVEADGTLAVQEWRADPDAPVDCFYVYPTISRDPTPQSDRDHSDGEEGYVALNQVARLGEVCRVYAPVYRQRTLAGLTAALGDAPQPTTADGEQVDPDTGYHDVLEAWRHYMANDNGGRPVVLVGHSQGATVLNRLVREEVDPNEDVRALLLSAVLAGSAVVVPDGADVGGDFRNVPLCRSDRQTGCVISWAAFRADGPPPPGALFGRPRGGADGVAACTNPAALAGGSAPLRPYFTAEPGASILSSIGAGGGGASWVDPAVGEITTPFVTTPGLVRGECVERDGFHYLEVTVDADPTDPRADDVPGDLTPEWGLHLVDVNLVMGDLVDLVRRQAAAVGDSGGGRS